MGIRCHSTPKKTILVHLRLDDVRACTDYDGSICAENYRTKVNDDDFNDLCDSCRIGLQSPLSYYKLNPLIQRMKTKYPDREVIIITNPGENIQSPYRIISNSDESLDLYLLCNSEVLILSRSTFALSALIFGIGKDVLIPRWCHTSMFGLETKYDITKTVDSVNLEYFS